MIIETQESDAADMTLRDWFAGQALIAMGVDRAALTPHYLAIIAKAAYEFANAMIEERQKPLETETQE